MQFLKQRVCLSYGVMVLLLSAITFAQTAPINSVDVPIANQVAVNQCSAGEPVVLNGTLHVEYSISTDTNGNNLFTVMASNSLTGTGQSTASRYAAADSQDYTFSSTQSSTGGTVELKADLVPQGAAGTPMTVVQQLQLTVDTVGNLNVQVVSNTTSCGS